MKELANVKVRAAEEQDLDAVDRVFRLAFGTFLGLPDPTKFGGDAATIRTRARSSAVDVLVAELDGEIVGSNVVTSWGSVGFFGPLTVRPDLWDRGVARVLLEPTMELFARKNVRVRGLYTFAQSAKHVRLYQRFGFWPRFLNATLSTSVTDAVGTAETAGCREDALAEVRAVSEAVFPGFDPTGEITSVADQRIGDTVVVREDGRIVAFAVCHVGAGSEAGSGNAYVKVAAALPGANAFERLLDACQSFAANRGASRLRAGVHTSRLDAYRTLIRRGWRTEIQGVSMISPEGGGGYDRPDAFVLEDWR